MHWDRYQSSLDKFYQELSMHIKEVTASTELKLEEITCETPALWEYTRMSMYDWEPKCFLIVDWNAGYMVHTDQPEEEHKWELSEALSDACHDEGLIHIDDNTDARMNYHIHWLHVQRRRSGCFFRKRAFVELIWQEEFV
jgi:hypothetical protein